MSDGMPPNSDISTGERDLQSSDIARKRLSSMLSGTQENSLVDSVCSSTRRLNNCGRPFHQDMAVEHQVASGLSCPGKIAEGTARLLS